MSDPGTPRPADRDGIVRPADRYGTARTGPLAGRRAALPAAGLALAAGIGFLGWVAWHQGRTVSWQEVTFQPGDTGQVPLTFQVTRPGGREVTCTVTALNRRHAVVGRRDVVAPAGDSSTVQLRTQIRTVEPAVSAAVDRCAVTG